MCFVLARRLRRFTQKGFLMKRGLFKLFQRKPLPVKHPISKMRNPVAQIEVGAVFNHFYIYF